MTGSSARIFFVGMGRVDQKMKRWKFHALKGEPLALETATKTDENDSLFGPKNASSAAWSSPPSLQRSISLAPLKGVEIVIVGWNWFQAGWARELINKFQKMRKAASLQAGQVSQWMSFVLSQWMSFW